MNVVKASSLRKPGLGAQINWGHPLSIGMDSCLLFNDVGKNPRDIASPNRIWTVALTQATIQGTQGAQQVVADMSAAVGRRYVPAPTFPLNSGSWTCRIRGKFTATATSGSNTSVGWAAGGSGTDAGFAVRNALGMATFSAVSGETDTGTALTINPVTLEVRADVPRLWISSVV